MSLQIHTLKKKTNNVTTSSTTTTATVTTAADANYFKSSFNSDSDGWSGRGDASVAVNKDNYYSGNGSIKVTGRTKDWNGAAIALDSSYKAGETYSFSAAVLQKAKESDTFNITLQYNDSTGTESYDNIATVKANKNTWTKLENTNYTIPAGATDLIIYIETAESTIDFFVDEAAVSAAGTKSAVTTGSGTVAEEPEVISQVDPAKPMIAISFDDGCSPANNKRIVDALTEQGFHATFFYVSNWSQGAENQAEIKYAYSKGMEIANHTVSHPYLSQKSSSEIRQEADGCHNYLKSVIGAEPSKLLRLPYLDQGGAVKSTLTDYGLVTDAIDTEDYKDQTSTAQIVQTIKNAMANGSGNGAVVLCHETKDKTAAAIEQLAPYIKEQGWQIVTISEMFEAKGKSIPYGQIITRV
jgi:peptidoglycan/xylan/chitin deacetylase (PgdA/CDA1 family)